MTDKTTITQESSDLSIPSFYRPNSVPNDNIHNVMIDDECIQMINIMKLNECECNVIEMELQNSFFDRLNKMINSINKINTSNCTLIVGSSHKNNVTKLLTNVIETHIERLYEKGHRYVILGTSDDFDFSIAEHIMNFNISHENDPIKTVCLNSTIEKSINAIKKNIYYDYVIDYGCGVNEYSIIVMRDVLHVLSFIPIPQKDWLTSLSMKINKCCVQVKKNASLKSFMFDEELQAWDEMSDSMIEFIVT